MPSPRTRAELFFGARCDRPPTGTTFAHGRLVLLGEHLDHQGGRVLVVPVREGVAVAWGVRPDTRIAVWSVDAREKDRFVSGEWAPTGRRWSDMAKGVCARAAEHGRLPGLDLVVTGDLPARQGLASSAAYLTALFEAVYAVLEVERPPAELAGDVAQVEREWTGVACGPLDPYVASVGAPGEVLLVDCRSLSHETLPVPAGAAIDHVPTGVERSLADSPYNERLAELAQALATVQARDPGVERLVDLSLSDLDDVPLPEVPRMRARHVVTETDRVAHAVTALQTGDLPGLGHLLLEGHRSLSVDFESSLPEIDDLVESLCARPGVHGARLSGAGWGGRVVVLRDAGAEPA